MVFLILFKVSDTFLRLSIQAELKFLTFESK